MISALAKTFHNLTWRLMSVMCVLISLFLIPGSFAAVLAGLNGWNSNAGAESECPAVSSYCVSRAWKYVLFNLNNLLVSMFRLTLPDGPIFALVVCFRYRLYRCSLGMANFSSTGTMISTSSTLLVLSLGSALLCSFFEQPRWALQYLKCWAALWN